LTRARNSAGEASRQANGFFFLFEVWVDDGARAGRKKFHHEFETRSQWLSFITSHHSPTNLHPKMTGERRAGARVGTRSHSLPLSNVLELERTARERRPRLCPYRFDSTKNDE
jgi:hypothetical protein